MILRLLFLIAMSVTICGCSKSSLYVRVLDADGSPLEGATVEAQGGPYFADLRGPFGHFEDIEKTNANGESELRIPVNLYCRLSINLGETTIWYGILERDILSEATVPMEVQTDPVWVYSETDVGTPAVFVRFRD